jgi:hypothetical protein
MKYILKLLTLSTILAMIGCEREFESEGIAEGVIRFPSIELNQGASLVLLQNSGSYVEPGAIARFGEDDISSEMVVVGADEVDVTTPGAYPITYSVSVTNELGQPSTVVKTRWVIIATEDISAVDLSGNYAGTGFQNPPLTVRVTKLGDGLYTIQDVLSSDFGIRATFAHIGGDVIQIPSQDSPYGELNTTSEGASATLTPTGFTWSVFIGCCGIFGPIEFVKL